VDRVRAARARQVRVDAGAARALRGGSASLLGVGVTGCDGDFVRVTPSRSSAPDGDRHRAWPHRLRRGRRRRLKGLATDVAVATLGAGYGREVVHRDDLAVLG
jgi:glutamate 5-kinase